MKPTDRRLPYLPVLALTLLLAATPTIALELLQNPGFEDAGKHWGKFGSVDFHDWAKQSGTYGAVLYGWTLDGEGGFFQSVPAEPGKTYTFTVRVKKESLFQADTVYLRFEFYSGDDTTKAGHDQAHVNIVNDITEDWQPFAITGTAPLGTAFIRPIVGYEGAHVGDLGQGKQACMLDNATLTVSP